MGCPQSRSSPEVHTGLRLHPFQKSGMTSGGLWLWGHLKNILFFESHSILMGSEEGETLRRKIWLIANAIKLRDKIIILFLICVLFPLITTNGLIIWSMKQGMNKEQDQRIENMADRLEFELSSNISAQLSIADYLNRNTRLKQFLEREYTDRVAYYEAYVQLMDDQVIQYYYTAQSAYNIVICTGNNTITNGTYFIRNDTVKDSSWYRAFEESGRNILLYSYYEDGRESGGYISKGRRVVLIQKLNYCGENNIIMLELDYQSMLESMERICDQTDGYLCIGNRILFSTRDKDGREKEFWDLSAYQEKECSLQRTMELYGQELSFYLTEKRPAALDMICEQKKYILLLYLINLLLPSLFIYIFYRSLHDRVALTQEYLDRVKEGSYEVIPGDKGIDEIGAMIHSYNLMVMRIKELIEVVFKNKEREQSLEIAKKQAELRALQSQLNPHFIFNALESIRMHSILKQETETARILESFAVLMRKNIQWNRDLVTIEEECDNVRRYLEIQKYRFGERLEFFLHVQEECQKRLIPKFIIITFVENACVHGIENSLEGGSVTVMVSEDEEFLYFEIMDQGSGMEREELEELKKMIQEADIRYIKEAEKSIGIVNTVVRMHQYYGEKVEIDINSAAQEGTEICIQLPKNRIEEQF